MTVETKGYPMKTIILGVGINDTVVVNDLEFTCPFKRGAINSDETQAMFIMPIGGTIYNLFVLHNNAQAVSGQVVTVRNGAVGALANTALAVTIPTTATTQTSNTTDRVHVAQGSIITFQFDSPTGSTAALIRSVSLLMDLDG